MANLKQIEKYLKEKRIIYKVVDLGGKVYTVEEVTKTGVVEGQIVKTLIVRIANVPYYSSSPSAKLRARRTCFAYSSSEAQRSREVADQGNSRQARIVNFVALAVRGKDRVDFKKVRRIFGGKATLASADQVLEVVGVSVGAVCPILIGLSLYLDKNVMNLKRINMGSGDLTKGLEMELSDLLSAVGKYQLADLV